MYHWKCTGEKLADQSIKSAVPPSPKLVINQYIYLMIIWKQITLNQRVPVDFLSVAMCVWLQLTTLLVINDLSSSTRQTYEGVIKPFQCFYSCTKHTLGVINTSLMTDRDGDKGTS